MWLKNLVLGTGVCATLIAGARPTPPVVEPEGAVAGRVAILQVNNDSMKTTDVFMLVDEAGEKGRPDGTVDRAFRLQVDPGVVAGLRREFTDAQVTWTPRGVRLVVGEQERFAFVLAKASAAPVDGEVHGYGLGHIRSWDLELPRGALGPAEFAALERHLLRVQASCSPVTCNSGGDNTSNCTVSGCSSPPTGCSIICTSGGEPCCGCASSGEACCRCKKPNAT